MTDSIAVIDIDGVVADVRHRLHHIAHRPPRWDAFFAAAQDDPALPEGLELVALLSASHRIVWLSGRPERLRAVTERWLAEQDLSVDTVLLRAEGDRRPASVLKVEFLRELARSGPVGAFVDDDPAVVAAARAAGFPAVCAEWSDRVDGDDLSAAQEQSGST
ncbi:MAG: hypothetical protein ACR2KJ_09325 [Jatrophihabitans sp.]